MRIGWPRKKLAILSTGTYMGCHCLPVIQMRTATFSHHLGPMDMSRGVDLSSCRRRRPDICDIGLWPSCACPCACLCQPSRGRGPLDPPRSPLQTADTMSSRTPAMIPIPRDPCLATSTCPGDSRMATIKDSLINESLSFAQPKPAHHAAN